MDNIMGNAYIKALVAKENAKRKLARDWDDFKNGEMSAQGLIEYVLIIAVISMVVIYAGPKVAQAITQQFNKIGETLSTGTSGGFGN